MGKQIPAPAPPALGLALPAPSFLIGQNIYDQQCLKLLTQVQVTMDNLNPLELLKEEMENDDIANKVNTIHKIPIVVSLMPSEAIKNLLLPYLESLTKKEDDEVVFAIAEELGNVATSGTLQPVLSILEGLCSHDETVIRDRAVKTITKMLEKVSDSDIHNYILPMVIRLASNETNFTFRASAVNLICAVYPRAGQNKEKLRQKYLDIANEEMLLLQRVTAIKIPEMCKVYEKQYLIQDLITMLKNRSSDEQDQIRVLATESFKEVAKFLTRDENKTYIMPLIIQAAEDKSWRVRLSLSKNFTEIARSFGRDNADTSLIQTYGNLLKDPEVDVKIEAVKSLNSFVEVVPADKIGVLVNQVISLGRDSLPIVRANASLVIRSMIPSVSKDQAYQMIQPLIKDLMKDDNQEVRKGGIDAATKFVEVLGPEAFTALLPSFKACSVDPKWRVRLELVDNLAKLAISINSYDFYEKSIEPLFIIYLFDRATGVRNVGIRAVGQFVRVFGEVWVNSFLPKLEDILTKEGSYHFKIASLYSIKEIALSQLKDNKYVERCLSSIFKIRSSPVPNVREVSIKALRDIALKLNKDSIRDPIRKEIQQMANDQDFEVKMTAAEVLSKI